MAVAGFLRCPKSPRQHVQSQPLPRIGQARGGQKGDADGGEAGAAGEEEHQEDLVFYGFQRVHAGEDLAGHDAGEGDVAWRHGSSCRVPVAPRSRCGPA
jgi:hypothetical protein